MSTNEIVLSSHGLQLTIRELSRTPANDADKPYDVWLTCKVEIEVPNFSGSFEWMVLPAELRGLAEDLEAMNRAIGQERTVQFEPIEPEVKLLLHMNNRGQIDGEYRFRARSTGPELRGTFEVDQTYLRPLSVAFRALATA